MSEIVTNTETVIWKYALLITDSQTILVPGGAQILSVKNQFGTVTLWAVSPKGPKVDIRTIEIIGTGHPIPPGRRTFIGTILVDPFVWHVFERHWD